MKKLALLDRDGVINRERGKHTWLEADFEILPTVPEAIMQLQQAGYTVLLITNQSGIALGMYGHDEVEARHEQLNTRLREYGATTVDIFYCPHHPTVGKCLCRKPGSAMVERALAITGIPASQAFMVGDKERDMEAARAVGVEAILINANDPLLALLKDKEKLTA